VAANLQLVSAFVAAHSTAQEVFAAHLKDATTTTATSSQAAAADGSGGAAGSATAAAAVGSSDASLADRVLSESRGEVDAALSYAHEVRRVCAAESISLELDAES
jgi:hypothetical protein